MPYPLLCRCCCINLAFSRSLLAANENSSSALEEANKRFSRLKTEAKRRIKSLNEEIEKLKQQLKDVEKGTKGPHY